MTTTRTPEEILEEARTHIGRESEPVPSRYPVENDPIRRYCHMVDDDNPLFLDPEYAATTQYKGVIAPPFYIRQTTGPGPWPKTAAAPSILSDIPAPGSRNVNLNTEFEVFRPVRPGDQISYTQRIADVYIKGTRLDPKAFWFAYETIYRNQDNEVVMIMRNTIMRHRTPEELAAAGDA